MIRLLPFILLLLTLLLAARWFVRTPPARLARVVREGLRVALLAAMVAAGIYLSLRGLEEAGLPLIAYAISAFRQGWWPWGTGLPGGAGGGGAGGPAGGGGGSGGRKSEVRTRMLRMELEHASGRMDGEILAGRFAGRWLSELSDAELRVLQEECALAGDQSSRLLEAWIARERPGFDASGASGSSRTAGGADDSEGEGRMTPRRAREILGVGADATEDEIRAAHRRLMKKVHPDVGGSEWLARQINEARDVLLGAARHGRQRSPR